MICKFCLAEIEEETSVCPVCGKDLTEEAAEEITEAMPEEVSEEVSEEAAEEASEEVIREEAPAKKKSNVLITILSVIVILVLSFFFTYIVLRTNPTPGTAAFVEKMDSVTQTMKFWEKGDISFKKSYTVSDAAAEKKSDVVVATLGDIELTNGELQAYYWTGVYDYIDYYAYYLNVIGLDLSKPLDEQVFDQETGQTYQQMFLENALKNWQKYASLIMASKESGIDLSEKEQGYLETFQKQFNELAAEYNYTDLEEFIDKEFFPGSSVASYTKYNQTAYTALTYYDSVYNSLLPTQEQLEAYYTEHSAELEDKGYGKDDGKYYDVRHILIAPKGDGSTNADGTPAYTDAQWEECRATAQKLLDEYLAGEATEDAFATLATAKSEDNGSVANGGLYSNLTKDTNFVQEFKDWYLDESRKPGDTGLVKSMHGYHIMYFSDSEPIWEAETRYAILSEGTDKVINDAMEKWPMEVNYKKIVLGYVALETE